MNNGSSHPSASLLVSEPPWAASTQRPVRVALFGINHHRVTAEVRNLVSKTIQQSAEISFAELDGSDEADWSAIDADLVVVLGGDGSILRSAGLMEHNQLPVLGVNLGKLGFLADITPEQLASVFPDVVAGKCRIVEHLMFDCQIFRDGELIKQSLGLNETAVLGGPPFQLVEINLFIDGELATTYSCDGLLISTPVGSTAHNLSAGGPILRKNLDAFVISAVSPHTLTVRPVVDSADRVFELVVPSPEATASVVVDGHQIHDVQATDRIVVQRASPRFRLIEVEGHGYYRTLREKLGWAGQIQRQEPP